MLATVRELDLIRDFPLLEGPEVIAEQAIEAVGELKGNIANPPVDGDALDNLLEPVYKPSRRVECVLFETTHLLEDIRWAEGDHIG